MMYRVGGYGRASTGRVEQDTTIENQILLFKNHINKQGWQLTDLYIDRKTGTKSKRPELLRLLEDVKNNRIDIILVKDLSRLARNGELSYNISNLARDKGVHIISLDGMVNTMENNADMLGLLAWMYQKESENLSQRIKSIKQLGATSGKYQGSIPPYGYHNEQGKLFVRDDETPKIVKRIFREYMQGIGVDTIAKNLTLERVPTPAQVARMKNAGIEWHGNTVMKILMNPHYVGNLVQNKTATVSVVSNKRKENLTEEHIVVENTHAAIIPAETFEAVQKLMKFRKKDQAAPKLHLFTNVAYCSDCGKGMWYRSGRKGYICGSYGRYGSSKCSSHAVKEDNLVTAIKKEFDQFLEYVDLDILSKHFYKKIDKALNKGKKDLDKVDAKIQVLLNRKVNYVQMVADGIMDMETFKLSNETNEKELEKLRAEKEQLSSNVSENQVNLSNLTEDFMEFLYSPDILPEIIHRFIARIEIEADGTPKIYYNFQEPDNQLKIS